MLETKIVCQVSEKPEKSRFTYKEMLKNPGIYKTHPNGCYRFIVPIPNLLIPVINDYVDESCDMTAFQSNKFVLVDDEITLTFKNTF